MIYKNSNFGYVAIFLCCISSAISFVFIAHLTKSHNEMLSLAMVSGYTIILFHLINLKNLSILYKKIIQNWKLLFSMNLLTGINWLSGFSSLRYLDPATVVCIELGIGAVMMFLITVPLNKFKEKKHLIACLFFIVLSMALIVMQYIRTTSNIPLNTMMLGFFWCFLGGISAAFIGTHSVRMDVAGFSITEILATRFYLLLIFGAVMVFFTISPSEPIVIDWKYYFFASLVIVLFPLIMYQTSIKLIGPLLVSLLEPFTPIMTYFLQIAVGSYLFNPLTFILLLISSGAVIWFVKVEQRV